MSDVAGQQSVGYWVRRRRELQADLAVVAPADDQALIGDDEAA